MSGDALARVHRQLDEAGVSGEGGALSATTRLGVLVAERDHLKIAFDERTIDRDSTVALTAEADRISKQLVDATFKFLANGDCSWVVVRHATGGLVGSLTIVDREPGWALKVYDSVSRQWDRHLYGATKQEVMMHFIRGDS